MRRIALLSYLSLAFGCSQGGAAVPQNTDGGQLVDAGPLVDATPPCTQLPMPDGGPLKVTGHVVEANDAGNVPIPNAMVAVEYGGQPPNIAYVPYCDMAHASPYYVFGAYTDANGAFTIDVKEGNLGFHAFATGYYYSRATLQTSQAQDVTIQLEKLPAGQAKPIVDSAGFASSTVKAGAPAYFAANVRAASADAKDDLSDEILLVEPTHSWGAELDPPSVGMKDNFPSGMWSRTFAAPGTAGTYTYYFSATTGGCVTSDLQTFTLTVQ